MPCTQQGYAVKAGMLVGRGELLLFMDADGATRVSDLEKLEAALASICSGECDPGYPVSRVKGGLTSGHSHRRVHLFRK